MNKYTAELLKMIIKKVFVDDIPSQIKAFELIGKAYEWEVGLFDGNSDKDQ